LSLNRVQHSNRPARHFKWTGEGSGRRGWGNYAIFWLFRRIYGKDGLDYNHIFCGARDSIMFIEWLTTAGTLLLVLFFLGLLIFVHELGHLLVGLWRGLHVERFSIGMGKKIWGFRYRGVEYVISMLPFGGYVALPQLDPTDEPRDREGRLLPRAKPLDRILTAASGPLANILFGFVLATLVWWIGVYRPAPVTEYTVYAVQIDSPEYEAGLRPGDRIVAVNDSAVADGWGKIAENIALTRGSVRLTVYRNDTWQVIEYRPSPNPQFDGVGFPRFEVQLPVFAESLEPGYPAERAGVRPGDRIVALNNEPVIDSADFTERIWNSGGQPVSLTLVRDGKEDKIPDVVPRATTVDGKTVHLLGIRLGSGLVLTHLSPWWQFTNVLKTTRNTLAALVSRDSLVKPRHMGGPVGIVQMNYLMIRYQGLRQGLFFVVFVCFSLALINLLPVPVLDGGHIFFALFEGVIRRPVPTRLAYAIQYVFVILIISFMLYITFYDVKRMGRFLFPGEEQASPEQVTETQPLEAE
jgi:regulator of sigma E protease